MRSLGSAAVTMQIQGKPTKRPEKSLTTIGEEILMRKAMRDHAKHTSSSLRRDRWDEIGSGISPNADAEGTVAARDRDGDKKRTFRKVFPVIS